MKKSYLILFLFFIQSHLFAQDYTLEAPNYSLIEKNIKDKKSDFYYPKLMARYELSDTTMTLEQKRHLYYGYTFQPKYNPYGRSESSEKLRDVINKEKLSDEDLIEIIKLSNQALKDNPLDIRSLNYRLYSFEKQEKLDDLKKNLIKLEIIVDALVSSGDGTTKEKAFFVIETSHEYDLLGMFGFRFGGQQSLIEHFDYLTVAQNDENIKGLYFDVTPCLEFLGKKKK